MNVPLGFCQCGCGTATPPSYSKYRPYRFLPGHQRRKRPDPPVLLADGLQLALTRGAYTIISPEDADLAAHAWCLDAYGYAVRTVGPLAAKRTIRLHRVILERMIGRPLTPAEEPDHRDGNPLNNRRANLRLATHQQNLFNQKLSAANTSGYRGVWFSRREGKWRADLKVNGKKHALGAFATAEDAHTAHQRAANEHYGEWQR